MPRTNLSPSKLRATWKEVSCSLYMCKGGRQFDLSMMAQSCTHEAQKEDKLNDEGANTPPPSAQIC